mmetsp:Transcript_15029/g.41633  ORF Transcript_15029/g.41633 Transcript_15029/m.41633 type:complete len:80 (-) Transcript_15029:88-327(-)
MEYNIVCSILVRNPFGGYLKSFALSSTSLAALASVPTGPPCSGGVLVSDRLLLPNLSMLSVSIRSLSFYRYCSRYFTCY